MIRQLPMLSGHSNFAILASNFFNKRAWCSNSSCRNSRKPSRGIEVCVLNCSAENEIIPSAGLKHLDKRYGQRKYDRKLHIACCFTSIACWSLKSTSKWKAQHGSNKPGKGNDLWWDMDLSSDKTWMKRSAAKKKEQREQDSWTNKNKLI